MSAGLVPVLVHGDATGAGGAHGSLREPRARLGQLFADAECTTAIDSADWVEQCCPSVEA